MVKKILLYVLFFVVFIGLWNLFDFVYSLIINSAYTFDFYSKILIPFITAAILVFVLFIYKGFKKMK